MKNYDVPIKKTCRNCGDSLTVARQHIQFCWNCGVKWEAMKVEPTPGNWYYSNGSVYSDDGGQPHELIADMATGGSGPYACLANGYLMAASKRLLAACKEMVLSATVEEHTRDPEIWNRVNAAIESTKVK